MSKAWLTGSSTVGPFFKYGLEWEAGGKLFPAGTVGPGYLKALRGPFPGVRIVPTGGIGVTDVRRWLEAGAVAVGVGGELCPTTLIEAGRFEALTRRAERFRAAVRLAGAQPAPR